VKLGVRVIFDAEKSSQGRQSMECGDGRTISSDTCSGDAYCSAANQFSSSAAYDNGSGHMSHCDSSPDTDLADEESAVLQAANLLCSLRINAAENEQHRKDNFAGVNCVSQHENNTRNNACSCVAESPKSVLSECCNSVDCAKSTDFASFSDEINVDADKHLLENDSASLTRIDLVTNKIDNGAILQIDGTLAPTKRCRHATADSSSSVHDYSATDCDVVFSGGIEYRPYGCERHLYDIMELVSRDLSEPYSIYTYRYFIYNWPGLCFRVSVYWYYPSNR